MENEELRNPAFFVNTAAKIAEVHALTVPISKEPDFVVNAIDRFDKNIS